MIGSGGQPIPMGMPDGAGGLLGHSVIPPGIKAGSPGSSVAITRGPKKATRPRSGSQPGRTGIPGIAYGPPLSQLPNRPNPSAFVALPAPVTRYRVPCVGPSCRIRIVHSLSAGIPAGSSVFLAVYRWYPSVARQRTGYRLRSLRDRKRIPRVPNKCPPLPIAPIAAIPGGPSSFSPLTWT